MPTKCFKDLTLADDFMFTKIMRRPDICKYFLETVLETESDSITFPGYIAPHPPGYAPRTVRANLIQKGEVVCVGEIYLYHDAGRDINKTLRRHEDVLIWEMAMDRTPENIKDIRQICITNQDPYGYGYAKNHITRTLNGHPIFDDMATSQRIVLSTDYTVPNAHDDILALLDLLRGIRQAGGNFAKHITTALENIEIAPWTGDEYLRWLEEARLYEQEEK